MEELTGPVMGITLVLVAVFLPAAFLPGITGQIFRQFALVIAATAVISAINALTLKPAQCALWLRPRGEKRPTGSTGASTGSIEAMEDAYMGLVSRMVNRPGLMLFVFLRDHRGHRLAVSLRQPTGFLPTEDQGYAILLSASCPTAHPSRGPRRRTEKINDDSQEDQGIAGLGDHRRLFRPGWRQCLQHQHHLHRL